MCEPFNPPVLEKYLLSNMYIFKGTQDSSYKRSILTFSIKSKSEWLQLYPMFSYFVTISALLYPTSVCPSDRVTNTYVE